jgi:very-short-patch-repair endonuclease
LSPKDISELDLAKKRLIAALRYTAGLYEAGKKPITDVSATRMLALFEESTTPLEGVSFRPDAETWLSFRRLQEIPPPDVPEMFEDWVSISPQISPSDVPNLPVSKWISVDIETLDELHVAGDLGAPPFISSPDQVRDPKPGSSDTYSVLLKTADMPEFTSTWKAWIEGPYRAWATTEKPRRLAISAYNAVFKLHQEMRYGDAGLELIFGTGLACMVAPNGATIRAPLIEQPAEIELNELTGTLSVRPRRVRASLNLECLSVVDGIDGFLPKSRELTDAFAAGQEDPVAVFDPATESTYESILRSCAVRMLADGRYIPDLIVEGKVDTSFARRLPQPLTKHLHISPTWVVYARRRSSRAPVRDIEELIKKIQAASTIASLPPTGVQVVSEPSNELPPPDDGIQIGSSYLPPDGVGGTRATGSWNPGSRGFGGDRAGSEGPAATGNAEPYRPAGTSAQPIYFPDHYNDEQIQIVSRLESSDGVLVQGPPGTGKTHTICNIIAHYLALGRRVLVTAHTAAALVAVRDRMQGQIKDLVLSVIDTDAEGNAQLKKAVTLLAEQARSLDRAANARVIADLEAQIAGLSRQIDDIDRDLLAYARLNLEKRLYQGEALLPVEIAIKTEADAQRHAWLPDTLDDAPEEPTFGTGEIDELLALRRMLAGDVVYCGAAIIALDELPDLPTVAAAHEDLKKLSAADKLSDGRDLPVVNTAAILLGSTLLEAFATEETGGSLPSGGRAMLAALSAYSTLRKAALGSNWFETVWQFYAGRYKPDMARGTLLEELVSEWINISKEGAPLLLAAVVIPETPSQGFYSAVTALAAGNKPFGLVGGLFASTLKKEISTVLCAGRPPETPADWRVVSNFVAWRTRCTAFTARVTAQAGPLGQPERPLSPADIASLVLTRETVVETGRFLDRLRRVAKAIPEIEPLLKRIFPVRVDIRALVDQGECALAIEALEKNLSKGEYAEATALRRRLSNMAAGETTPLHEALAGIAQTLGNPEASDSDLDESWTAFEAEAVRVFALREKLARRDTLIAAVRESGAREWAARLAQPFDAANDDLRDRLAPDYWLETWEWARACTFLRRIAGMEKARDLAASRADAERLRRKAYIDVIRAKTFDGLKKRMTNAIDVALGQFLTSVQQLGAGTGTGMRTMMNRRAMQQAMERIVEAIPCWVMPEWRVCEQLPSNLGMFDLVIVDEASQSDIRSLPILLRAKKILIVGDNQQVTPTPIGIDQTEVQHLRSIYLDDIYFADQMDPHVSLYDFAGLLYPGKTLMLREHFRCVAPIIAFSSRFYPQPLVPLRQPSADQRLDPPLIDIYVQHGRQRKQINEAEAAVIVDQIAEFTEDPENAHRGIAVIALSGDKQGKYINDLLLDTLGSEVMQRHRIICGRPSELQGQERDVVYLSMVACPQTRRAVRVDMFRQRFNVAMSRARDRMILVRSVHAKDLSETDLKRAVIDHFKKPLADANISQGTDILEICESAFEREFGKEMLARNYRIRPQFKVGEYRIDFVIEGAGDRRLAVELDGDKYHGPERWQADFYRQKALERMKWQFWRCWASAWARDRQACLDDLLETLGNLGIEPIGLGEINTPYTLHLIVREEGAEPVPAPEHVPTDQVTATGASPTPAPAPEPTAHPEGIEVGDFVHYHFASEPKRRHLSGRLVPAGQASGRGNIPVDTALGAALLGAYEDSEIEYVGEQGVRVTVVIESVVKAGEELDAAD